jgi:hypothetical protein
MTRGGSRRGLWLALAAAALLAAGDVFAGWAIDAGTRDLPLALRGVMLELQARAAVLAPPFGLLAALASARWRARSVLAVLLPLAAVANLWVALDPAGGAATLATEVAGAAMVPPLFELAVASASRRWAGSVVAALAVVPWAVGSSLGRLPGDHLPLLVLAIPSAAIPLAAAALVLRAPRALAVGVQPRDGAGYRGARPTQVARPAGPAPVQEIVRALRATRWLAAILLVAAAAAFLHGWLLAWSEGVLAPIDLGLGHDGIAESVAAHARFATVARLASVAFIGVACAASDARAGGAPKLVAGAACLCGAVAIAFLPWTGLDSFAVQAGLARALVAACTATCAAYVAAEAPDRGLAIGRVLVSLAGAWTWMLAQEIDRADARLAPSVSRDGAAAVGVAAIALLVAGALRARRGRPV